MQIIILVITFLSQLSIYIMINIVPYATLVTVMMYFLYIRPVRADDVRNASITVHSTRTPEQRPRHRLFSRSAPPAQQGVRRSAQEGIQPRVLPGGSEGCKHSPPRPRRPPSPTRRCPRRACSYHKVIKRRWSIDHADGRNNIASDSSLRRCR